MVAMVVVAAAIYPLNRFAMKLPMHDALVRSLFFGLPALLMCWMPERFLTNRRSTDNVRRSVPKQREQTSEALCCHEASAEEEQKASKTIVAILVIFALVLGAMLVYNLVADGVWVAVTNGVGFGLIALAAVVEYKLGYLKI